MLSIHPETNPLLGLTLEQRLADLTRIARLEDPVLRNLLITQRYHDLSHELGRVLGVDNANWSTFATWASKTAGISIREEEIPHDLARALVDEAKLHQLVERLYDRLGTVARLLLPRLDPFDLARAIIAEVASQIAEGNLKVYAELAPLFAKFVDAFDAPHKRTDDNLVAFVNQLKPGPASQDGQDDLKKAFVAYFKAAEIADPALKAQYILYGNVQIGLHEQTRLQDNIAGGIDAPFSDRAYDKFFDRSHWILRPVVKWATIAAVNLLCHEFLRGWQRFATRFMMKLSSPNGDEISLGVDLPPGQFPSHLAELTLEELVLLLQVYDTDLNSTKGTAAIDWVNLTDRMRFIGELFRIKQCETDWFEQPFSPNQRAAIEAGVVPPGPLG